MDHGTGDQRVAGRAVGSKQAEPDTYGAERENDSGRHHRRQENQTAAWKTRKQGCAATNRMAPARGAHCSAVAIAQEIPDASRTRDVRPVMVEKQENQKKIVEALTAAGFALTWQPPAPADVRFRELQADPLAGAVAA